MIYLFLVAGSIATPAPDASLRETEVAPCGGEKVKGHAAWNVLEHNRARDEERRRFFYLIRS
jgi:hypothetical protein